MMALVTWGFALCFWVGLLLLAVLAAISLVIRKLKRPDDPWDRRR